MMIYNGLRSIYYAQSVVKHHRIRNVELNINFKININMRYVLWLSSVTRTLLSVERPASPTSNSETH